MASGSLIGQSILDLVSANTVKIDERSSFIGPKVFRGLNELSWLFASMIEGEP